MSDRKRQRLARELQRREGIKYTEALRRLAPGDTGGSDRIADAVRLARAESSAGLGFQPTQLHLHVADQLPAAAGRLLRGVGGWIKEKADDRLLTRGTRGDGRIDFAGQRSIYRAFDEWYLLVDGRSFEGSPGAWTERHSLEVSYNPEWTLAVLSRTTGSTRVGTRQIAGDIYHELTGVTTVDFAQWPEGEPFMSVPWLESSVGVRALVDEQGRLRLARLRWEYAPGQREAQFDQVRREAGGPDTVAPENLGMSGHDEVIIALGDFGTPWALEEFDPDDSRWDREP
jgi:hypothetical protein